MDILNMESTEIFLEYTNYLKEQKASGKKIIGYLSHEFIPDEIIFAANCIPVPLILTGDEDRTAIGAGKLTPTICPFALSMIGTLDSISSNSSFSFLTLLDGFIVSNYCTSSLLTSELISEQLELKRFDFHIPFLQSPAHVQYFGHQLEKLANDLANFAGSSLCLENLLNSTQKHTTLRELFTKVNQSSLTASQQLIIFQWCLLFGPDAPFISSIQKLIEKMPSSNPILNSSTSPRIIFTGCAPFLGDDILKFIEDSGAQIVWNDTWLGNQLFDLSIFGVNQQILTSKSLSEFFEKCSHRLSSASHSLHCSPNSLSSYQDYLVELAQKNNATGIIYHILKFCDIVGHHRQEMKDNITKRGIPILILERDYSKSISGQLRTRIEAFLEMVPSSRGILP